MVNKEYQLEKATTSHGFWLLLTLITLPIAPGLALVGWFFAIMYNRHKRLKILRKLYDEQLTRLSNG